MSQNGASPAEEQANGETVADDEEEERAAELIDRLTCIGAAADSLHPSHLRNGAVDAPMRRTADFLGARAPSLVPEAALLNAADVASAGDAVRRACASDADAAGGRLDEALAVLARTVGSAACTTRIDAVDSVVAFIEASSLLASYRSVKDSSDAKAGDTDVDASDKAMEVDTDSADTETARAATTELRIAARTLGAQELPSASETLSALESKLDEALQDAPEGHLDRILGDDCASKLTQHEMGVLRRIDDVLRKEYNLRREMLIRRAEVTTTSFLWSPRVKGIREDDVRKEINSSITEMSSEPNVKLEDVFDARNAALAFAARKTSTGDAERLNSTVKSVRIGAVPDRGGRTDVTRKGSMPAFQERRVTSAGGGGAGRGRGGRGDGGASNRGKQQSSGRVQGQWQSINRQSDGHKASRGGRGGDGGRKRKFQDAAVRW